MSSDPKRAAGFVIFRRLRCDIEYLLLKASYGTLHWSSPKGYVDPGEKDYDAAMREVTEETGYKQEDLHVYERHPWQLKYEVNGEPKVVTYWLAEVKNICKEPRLSAEHTEYKWLNKDRVRCIVGYPDYRTMLDDMHHYIVTKILVKTFLD